MILALLMLAQASQAAPVPQDPYRVVGEDSPWTLTIEQGRMRYEVPGRPPVSEAAPAPTDDQGTRSYSANGWSAMIMSGAICRGIDGKRYPDSVYVMIGQNERSGCGGQALPADSLAATSWHFAEIAGEAVPLTGDLLRDDIYAVDFGVETIVGYGGCNRFSAGYSQTGDLLVTRDPRGYGTRNCGAPISDREYRLLNILFEPLRISHPNAETMVLTGESGTIHLVRAQSDGD